MKKIGLLLAVLPVSLLAFSQSAPATASAPAVQVVTLGNSVVPLEQGWKFEPGDLLWVNGEPLWAQPEFDDAGWAAMDLTPKAGAVDMQFGTKGFLPGWTQKGFPNLSGYAWYRMRLRVADNGEPLWLKMPVDFDDATRFTRTGSMWVSAEGSLIITCGSTFPSTLVPAAGARTGRGA